MTQQVSARRPPGRRTRCSSFRVTGGSPTWLITKLPTTASNVSSSCGRSGRTATRTSAAGTLRAAVCAICGSASTADTSAPRRTASAATKPGPVPRSSTRHPVSTCAASRSGPIACAVSRAKPPSYAPARPAHNSRSYASKSVMHRSVRRTAFRYGFSRHRVKPIGIAFAAVITASTGYRRFSQLHFCGIHENSEKVPSDAMSGVRGPMWPGPEGGGGRTIMGILWRCRPCARLSPY